jgi:hypothetical protein
VPPLAGAVAPGGYVLVQLAGSGSVGAALPPPDATGAAGLDPAGGKVALASSAAALGALCPTVGVLDLVGWGTSPCFEGPGAAAAPAPPDAGAALVRLGAGCADGNGNAADLAAQLVQPRNAGSAKVICGCSGSAVNETNLSVEMDFCSIQAPASLGASAGTTAGPVWGRVFEPGVTEAAGAPAGITAQVGYGPLGTDPRYATGWTFVAASHQSQVGNDDEFAATFQAPAPGSYLYVYRFSPDGQRWTYCDPNGAGANPGLVFEPNALPTMTVVP